MTTKNNADELWSSGQAARYLSIAVSTIHDLCDKGAIKPVQVSPLGLLFSREELVKFSATYQKRDRYAKKNAL